MKMAGNKTDHNYISSIKFYLCYLVRLTNNE